MLYFFTVESKYDDHAYIRTFVRLSSRQSWCASNFEQATLQEKKKLHEKVCASFKFAIIWKIVRKLKKKDNGARTDNAVQFQGTCAKGVVPDSHNALSFCFFYQCVFSLQLVTIYVYCSEIASVRKKHAKFSSNPENAN